eukprot:TRINITY_DN12709_c0_g1_i2.p2 TRINITY_DN12709_c0_g1~~TRINITY_DN12709_c0_g1_i2.p2  ORF type:complete len:141 (-),score=26.68 TRINITY_DN12709_c0_g1_i2:25-447(-)
MDYISAVGSSGKTALAGACRTANFNFEPSSFARVAAGAYFALAALCILKFNFFLAGVLCVAGMLVSSVENDDAAAGSPFGDATSMFKDFCSTDIKRGVAYILVGGITGAGTAGGGFAGSLIVAAGGLTILNAISETEQEK